MTMLRVWVIAVLAGCGDGGKISIHDSSSGDGNGIVFDIDKLVRACAIVESCVGHEIGRCVADFAARGTLAQVDCLLAATVANCTAANACIGVTRTPDSNCMPGCRDANTLVTCNELGFRTELDCSTYIESSGPVCVTGTQSACGVNACSVEGDATCTGDVATYCQSGVNKVSDCGRVGTVCEMGGCVGAPLTGPCTVAFGCDGELLLQCDPSPRAIDCSKVVPDGICVTINNFVSCGWGQVCDLTYPTGCIGTTLRECVLGVIKDVDCTTIGGTTCTDTSPRPRCVP